MGKIDIIKLSYGPGDPVTIYRNSGRGDISGIIEEIGDGFILLRRPGARRPDCVFEDLIAGCGDYEPTGEAPVEEKTGAEAPRVSAPASESVTPAEEPTETIVVRRCPAFGFAKNESLFAVRFFVFRRYFYK